MKKLNLAVKIGLGYGIVVLFLLIVSGVSWYGLFGVEGGFVDYRGFARDTNLAGRLQANMLMVRMNVKDFLLTGSDEASEEFTDYVKKMNIFLGEAREEIQEPERSEKIDFIADVMNRYEAGFYRVREIHKVRDKIVYDVLRGYGPSMEEDLSSIIFSARKSKDVDAAYEAGMILRHMFRGRLYGQEFLDTNDPADLARLEDEFQKVFEGVYLLAGLLENPDDRALNEKVGREARLYLDGCRSLAAIIYERNAIIVDTLDKIGPEVAAAVEDVKLSVKREQDLLGPLVQSKTQKTIRLTLMISGLAILASIVFGFILTRSITGPVQRVVDYVGKVAGGDFTESLAIDQEDEVGRMSAALGRTVLEIGEMIKDIIVGVNTLSSSSTELSAISSQLSSTSENAAGRASAVASASEEMSINMGSVSAAMEQSASNVVMIVTAVEEMGTTVGGIAQDTARAKTVAETAVVQTHETLCQVSDLGEAANRIGKVTEVITEISEQTNLLALNATIEAARAGEAGKGFAVVANEIKELAKQTAEATVDIKNQIEGMQGTTNATISGIQAISNVINEINEIIISIASAVEQQSIVTSEISENVSQASEGINEVNESVASNLVAIGDTSRDIGEISLGSDEIRRSSLDISQSADELLKLSEHLDDLTRRFKVI